MFDTIHFTDIDGRLDDRLAPDGVHRTLDASAAEGPASIRLFGFADEVIGSDFGNTFHIGGDIRVPLWDAFRGGVQSVSLEITDTPDLVIHAGAGRDHFDFDLAAYASIGRVGWQTPGHVSVESFEIGDDTLDISSFTDPTLGSYTGTGLIFDADGSARVELSVMGRTVGQITIEDFTYQDAWRAYLDGELPGGIGDVFDPRLYDDGA